MTTNQTVPITLDRERQLRLGINELCDAEQASSGQAINDFLVGARISLLAIRALLWAGLKHEDRRLTLAEVGDLIQPDQIPALVGKIREAFVASGIAGKNDGGANG